MRLGLVELYHYDVEEFWFRDGHLLLRGNNGTGKSKVLSLTLPFLLDANLSASRLEPDGDRNKRMEWNLLMNGRHERRIGYTWIEFGRRDESGDMRALTLGCGLRAVAGRPSVDTWYFVTDQRIGADLWLTTHERTALSRERLTEAIGSRGQVFDTAQAYRRAVDERLFRLGTDRYAALVDTLIQLRQPQLSKQPNETRLSDALTEALPPLDRAALEDVADALNELEDIRRRLDELEAMRKAVATFGNRYRRYAQVASRRRARSLRQAQTEYDNASRDVNAASEELEEARQTVAQCRSDEQVLDEQLAADNARLRVLHADPVMRDARRIADARERAAQCRTNLDEAEQRVSTASERLGREKELLGRRQEQSALSRTQLIGEHSSVTALATQTGVADAYARGCGGVVLPDGVRDAPSGFVSTLLREARDGEARRREQIGVIRKRLQELHTAEEARTRAHDSRAMYADAFDAASESARRAAEHLARVGTALVGDWRRHGAALRVLELRGFEELLGELESWIESLEGQNPMRAALESTRQLQDERIATREAELAETRRMLVSDQGLLQAERARLEAGEDQPPPTPHTRGAEVRAGRPGAPLWQLVDFATHVPASKRAGLEAALESAGLLDAWVLPDGVVLDAQTHDVMLVPRAPHSGSLADWLVPTVPGAGPTAAVHSQIVSALLRSIACGEDEANDAEAWVSPNGEFRLGAARGAWMKPEPRHIGHEARDTARRSRLAELAARLAEIEASLTACDASAEELATARLTARNECAAAPPDDELRAAHARLSASEHQRRDAQTRLGEAEARLAAAENAHARARDALEFDARDLSLPEDTNGIAEFEHALNEYRVGVTELVNAVRLHQNALGELADQLRRETEGRQDFESATSERRDKQRYLREAQETVGALQASVGKKVDELLRETECTEAARQQHERTLKDARAALIVASGRRGTAEQKYTDLTASLEKSAQLRKQMIDDLQAYSVETGFLAVALPDLPLPDAGAPWGVDAALTVARRAEQTLVDVSAEDADWERIQRAIGHDFTELQSAMSAQGHSATAEPSDYGLIVRIVYQQQSERPHTLERRLVTELDEQRLMLSAQERSVLEEHLEKEIAANLQRMIRETEARVTSINTELHRRPTSTGVRYRLEWQTQPEDAQDTVPGLAEARKRLLKTSADAWSADDRRQVGEFLQSRINAERIRDDQGTLFESLARALDYRKWHRFRVQRWQDGAWKPLSGPASSGERALGLTVPLFAAASSHYESADVHAPRLVLLDEAFAGIDDEARANCMALIREFDLDFAMTSEREWGCYPELPGLSICQLVRREGMDAVFVSRWTWDGRVRRAEKDPARRFPEAATNEA